MEFLVRDGRGNRNQGAIGERGKCQLQCPETSGSEGYAVSRGSYDDVFVTGTTEVEAPSERRRAGPCGQDGTIKFGNMSDQQELVSFQRHRDLMSGLAFTRDGGLHASSGGLVTRR